MRHRRAFLRESPRNFSMMYTSTERQFPFLTMGLAAMSVAVSSLFYKTEVFNFLKQKPSVVSSESITEKPLRAVLEDKDSLVVQQVGVIRSIYRLCVGTPRQGMLAPQARGRIEFTVENASDMVDGLEEFSHIWIVFVFHLNTASKKKGTSPSKIAPPALGGRKVGVLATRSPHRGNPIGMTLCKLDSIEYVQHGSQQKKQVVLHISGLDLVDGTPVLDVKPYVPHYDSVHPVQVPTWVSDGLATKRPVVIMEQAKLDLHSILKDNPNALEFYGSHRGDENVEDEVFRCIEQVLAVDVRSTWQTKKARDGKSQAERADRVQDIMASSEIVDKTMDENSTDGPSLCSQQLDNLLIQYTVEKPKESHRSESEGSGAEDVVTIHSIQMLLKDEQSGGVGTSKDEMELEEYEEEEATASLSLDVVPLNKKDEIQRSVVSAFTSDTETTTNLTEPVANLEEPIACPSWDVVATDNTPEAIISSTPTTTEAATHTTTEVTANQEQSIVCPSVDVVPPENANESVASPFTPSEVEILSDATTEPQSSEKTVKRGYLPSEKRHLLNPPQDGEYSAIKSYWSKAANVNTPTGIVPAALPRSKKAIKPRELAKSVINSSANESATPPSRKETDVDASDSPSGTWSDEYVNVDEDVQDT